MGGSALTVKHGGSSVHYTDLDRDGRIEIVIREQVGRRGTAHQWTYVDKLVHWSGSQFSQVDEDYPRYHDEETLPNLLQDLIDHHDAKRPILDEKVEAIEAVRKRLLAKTRKPRGFGRRVVKALATLQKEQFDIAGPRLRELQRQFAYEPQVHLGARTGRGGSRSLGRGPRLRDSGADRDPKRAARLVVGRGGPQPASRSARRLWRASTTWSS